MKLTYSSIWKVVMLHRLLIALILLSSSCLAETFERLPPKLHGTGKIEGNSFIFTRFDVKLQREVKDTITFSPLPEKLEPGQTVTLQLSCKTDAPDRSAGGSFSLWWVSRDRSGPDVLSVESKGNSSSSSSYSFVFQHDKSWGDPIIILHSGGSAGGGSAEWHYAPVAK